MVKYYCDRCGKEVAVLDEVRIPDVKHSSNSFSTKTIQVCKDCKKKADNIYEKLIDIRFTLFRDYMEGSESNAE